MAVSFEIRCLRNNACNLKVFSQVSVCFPTNLSVPIPMLFLFLEAPSQSLNKILESLAAIRGDIIDEEERTRTPTLISFSFVSCKLWTS